jgi:hypothetical protein
MWKLRIEQILVGLAVTVMTLGFPGFLAYLVISTYQTGQERAEIAQKACAELPARIEQESQVEKVLISSDFTMHNGREVSSCLLRDKKRVSYKSYISEETGEYYLSNDDVD